MQLTVLNTMALLPSHNDALKHWYEWQNVVQEFCTEVGPVLEFQLFFLHAFSQNPIIHGQIVSRQLNSNLRASLVLVARRTGWSWRFEKYYKSKWYQCIWHTRSSQVALSTDKKKGNCKSVNWKLSLRAIMYFRPTEIKGLRMLPWQSMNSASL